MSRPYHLTAAATLVAVLAVIAAGCGDPGSIAGGAEPDTLDGDWVLTSGHGPDGEVPLGDQVTVTLQIDGAQWRGVVCNHYFADAEVRGAQVTVSGVGGTDMACDGPLMDAERIYWAALPEVTTWSITDDVLTLSGPEVSLVYERSPEVEAADLVGTTWHLEALVIGTGDDGTVSSVIGEQRLMLEDDGQLVAETGCNGVAGPYEVVGDRLVTGELIGTLMGCEDAVMRQETHIGRVLQAGPTIAIDGDRLTLTAEDDGLGLVYRADS